jgi:hypothetical protein
MAKQMIRHCENCGDDLGGPVEKLYGDEMVTCGKRECQREANYDAQARQDYARMAAEDDDYGRYR